MSGRQMLRVIFFVAVVAIPATIYLSPQMAAFFYAIIAALTPVWLPILLLALFWPLWTTFVRSQFVMSVPYSIMELKPGKETPRSARAMELIFYSLHHRTDISRVASVFFGHIRLPWSFEIHAHAGNVRFYVYLPTAHRSAVEARIRNEYRDIDIDETWDYSRDFHFDPFSMRVLVREYTLKKADPYPLRTFVSYEAEKDKRDVFNELLEELLAVSEHEHVFVSWIIRPHQRERKKIWLNPTDSLHEDAHEEIAHIIGPKGDLHALSQQKQEQINAIESALKKPSFDCGARALYLAKREHWNDERARSLDLLLDGFGDENLNAFESYDPKDNVDWPLSEVFAVAPALAMGHLLQLYRRRAFFSPPYYGRAFVLNTEELATVYHMPHVSRASALAKMRGLTLEPPDNLPV
jgi:hypothetical protein